MKADEDTGGLEQAPAQPARTRWWIRRRVFLDGLARDEEQLLVIFCGELVTVSRARGRSDPGASVVKIVGEDLTVIEG
jgi:hypothetical protein